MKIIKQLWVLFLPVMSFGQSTVTDATEAAKYAPFIDTADLKKHLYHVASPEMEGRETASEGQRKAAAYIEEYFRAKGLKAGFEGSYQQPFPVYRDSITRVHLEIARSPLKSDTDYVISFAGVVDTALRRNQVVFVGYGLSDSTQDDYKNVDVKGKVVLVLTGAPATNGKKRVVPVPSLYTLSEAARKNGAAVLLVANSRFPRPKQSMQGPMYVERPADTVGPAIFIVSDSVAKKIMGKDYTALKKMKSAASPLAKTYNVPVSVELRKVTQEMQSSNVIGILEGTSKKDEALVITAHYDHIGKKDTVINYGADDDGSGTVTILELTEAFSQAAASGAKPKRTIIFMTVSGEEKGLWGSDYYSSHPVFPLDKTSANINIDMIGRVESGRKKDSINYVYVVGDNRLSSDLRPISEAANKKTFNFTLDYKFNAPDDPERIYYRSDHYNFAKHGVPVIFYFNGLHEDYHRPTDTPDKINYPLLAKRAQLIFHTAWEIANRDEMLKRDLP